MTEWTVPLLIAAAVIWASHYLVQYFCDFYVARKAKKLDDYNEFEKALVANLSTGNWVYPYVHEKTEIPLWPLPVCVVSEKSHSYYLIDVLKDKGIIEIDNDNWCRVVEGKQQDLLDFVKER